MPDQRILVVDDDPMVLRLVTAVLSERGYRVLVSEDGESALELARAEKPDLVILDLLLPGIDGFEVCRLLGTFEETKETRVIMLTGVYETPNDMRHGLEAGASHYLLKSRDGIILGKPFDVDHLVRVVEDELAGRAAGQKWPQERILIVDDDRVHSELLKRSLEQAGYAVLTAADGESGMAILAQEKPDLMLLDYRLPVRDGLSVLSEVRRRFPGIAIVFMTAYGSEDVAVQALRQGADDYLIKPFVPQGLVAVVEENLEKGRQRRLTRTLMEELNRSTRQLRQQQQEMQQQHAALQDAYAQLQDLNRMREDLLSMVVHDLKNPVAVMTTAMELLGEDFASQMDEEQRAILTSSRRASMQLLSLVNNLLDVQRLEAGRMPLLLQNVNLMDVIDHVMITSLPRFREGRLTLKKKTPDVLPEIRADVTILERIIDNLVDNAIKFSPPGGTITISAHYVGNEVHITVDDEGEGIPVPYRRQIFEKFAQVKDAKGPQRGSGLGLTFCKLATEAHGGRIWVEDNEPRGSRFVVALPVGHSEGAMTRS